MIQVRAIFSMIQTKVTQSCHSDFQQGSGHCGAVSVSFRNLLSVAISLSLCNMISFFALAYLVVCPDNFRFNNDQNLVHIFYS